MSNDKKQQLENDLKTLKSLLSTQQLNNANANQNPEQKQKIIKQSSWFQKFAPSRIWMHGKNLSLSLFSRIYKGFEYGTGLLDGFISLILNRNSNRIDPVISYVRKPAVFGAYVVLIFVVGGGIWAATAPLDSATSAQGTLVYEGHRKLVQYPEVGIIKDIVVKVGDHVSKGDPIIYMDDTRLSAELSSAVTEQRLMLAIQARLTAEQGNLDHITYPNELLKIKDDPEVKEIMRIQNDTFSAKRELLSATISNLKSQLSETEERRKGYEIRKKNFEEAAKIALDRVQKSEKLLNKGIVSREELMKYRTIYLDASSNLSNLKSEINGLIDKKNQIEYTIAQTKAKDSSDNLREMAQTRNSLDKNIQIITKSQDALNRVVVRAPESGIINEINFHTKGGVVGGGATLAEISPDGTKDQLIIEARVQPRDITRVHEGEEVKIKFSAFKSRTSATFKGKVLNVSADSIQDKNRAPQPGQSDTFYMVKIELDAESFKNYQEQYEELRPGMQVDVSIIHGSMTLLRYLLSQIIDQVLFKAFNER